MTPKSQSIVYYIYSIRSVTTTTTADIYLHIQHMLGFFMESNSLIKIVDFLTKWSRDVTRMFA